MEDIRLDTRIKALLMLIVGALEDQVFDTSIYTTLTDEDWNYIVNLSSRQGVSALVLDGLEKLPKSCCPPILILMRLAKERNEVEQMNHYQLEAISRISSLFVAGGLKTVVLKGIVCSSYYPNKFHRLCGDFDFCLCGKYRSGNGIIIQNGGIVVHQDYKHTQFIFDGFVMENHRFCIEIRGSKQKKKFEKHLERLAANSNEDYEVNGAKVIFPCADFNALFLTMHAFQHFLSEGIDLKQLCDWSLFIRKEADNVNWASFEQWTRSVGIWKFALLVTRICEKYINAEVPAYLKRSITDIDELLCDKIFYSTLFDEMNVYNKDYGPWRQRLERTKNMLRNSWKFSEVYNRNLWSYYANSAFAFIIERNPHL